MWQPDDWEPFHWYLAAVLVFVFAVLPLVFFI